MPIWKAVEHVAKAIGDSAFDQSYPDTLIQIRQAAVDGCITLWGKLEREDKASYHSDIWTPIEPSYWEKYRLNALATGEAYPHADHTWAEAYDPRGYQRRYYAILAGEADIKRIWPNA
jgi:hypothetical protein